MRKSTKKELELMETKKSINIITKKDTYKGFKGDKKNVLCIPDIHQPFTKPGFLEFVQKIQKKYNTGITVNLGDEVDLHAFSAYQHDAEGMSAGDELKAAIKGLNKWFKAFPETKSCLGNHLLRIYKKAAEAGLPSSLIKPLNSILEAPKGWEWADSWDIHGVHYTHGNGSSGPQSAIRRAILNQQSTVMGHLHSEASIQYSVSKRHKLFGMICGSGINDEAYAFSYGKDLQKKWNPVGSL
jgi:hypothetical protein